MILCEVGGGSTLIQRSLFKEKVFVNVVQEESTVGKALVFYNVDSVLISYTTYDPQVTPGVDPEHRS